MFLTAIYKRESEQEVLPNAPNERLGRNTPGLSTVKRSEDLNQWEDDNQGTVAVRLGKYRGEWVTQQHSACVDLL